MWIKVYKTFRGGRSADDYLLLDESFTEDEVQEEAISWADKTSGGSNYGWKVYWEEGTPTLQWLNDEIDSATATIEGAQDYINLLKTCKKQM